MCGWDEAEVEGRTCSILQGEGTCWPTVAAMSAALSRGEDVRCQVINYRKCGNPFWNVLSIHPVKSGSGDILLYIGFLRDYSYHMTRLVSVQPQQFALRNACACVTLDTSLGEGVSEDDNGMDLDEDGEKCAKGKGGKSKPGSADSCFSADAGRGGRKDPICLENPSILPSPAHNCCKACDGETGGMAPTSQLFSKAITLTPEYLALRAQDFLLSRGWNVYVADSAGHIAPSAASTCPQHLRYSLTAVKVFGGGSDLTCFDEEKKESRASAMGAEDFGSSSDSSGGTLSSLSFVDELIVNVNVVPREEGLYSVGLRRLGGSAAAFYKFVEEFKLCSEDMWEDGH